MRRSVRWPPSLSSLPRQSTLPYDDDDDLFGEEFDFVDDDDDAEVAKEPSDLEEAEEAPKPRRRGSAKGKADKSEATDKPAGDRPRNGGRPPAHRRGSRPPEPEAPMPEPGSAALDDGEVPDEIEAAEQPAPVPAGPPADHVVHIYEFGHLKRTIPRKFTDEEAVNFAEEYTRTGKAYGRYAIATPDDEEPSPTFAGASRGG
jgi:hypothetical protein